MYIIGSSQYSTGGPSYGNKAREKSMGVGKE